MIRDGLTMLINSQKDLEVVACAGDAETGLEAIERTQPDIVILGLNNTPRINTLEWISRLKNRKGQSKLLVLAGSEDLNDLRQALKDGVAGYLLKRSSAEEFVKAIRTIALGGRYLDPSAIENLIDVAHTAPRPEKQASALDLSEREEEVLRLIAQGHSNKEIAGDLGVSTKTIETYKSRSMAKLGLRGRADIVRYAIDRSWMREGT